MKQEMPHNIDAENAVLSISLQDDSLFQKARNILSSDDFFISRNRRFFEAIKSTAAKGRNIEPHAVAMHMKEQDTLFEGDVEFLSEIIGIVLPTEKALKSYCEQVKNASLRRKVIQQMQICIEDLYGNADLNETVSKIKTLPTTHANLEWFTFADRAEDYNDRIIASFYSEKKRGFKTGYAPFDYFMAGYETALITVGGRTGMGKSQFTAMILAESYARSGYRVWYHSLEDDWEDFYSSYIASKAGVSIGDLYDGKVKPSVVNEIQADLYNLPLYLSCQRFSTDELRAACESRKGQFDIIFIDQISHVKKKKSFKRNEAFAVTHDELFAIKKDLGLMMFVNSQMNRLTEEAKDKRPTVANLAESSVIENNSDVIILLYREGYYNENIEDNMLEAIIAKNKKNQRRGSCVFTKMQEGGFQCSFAKRR